MGDQAVCSFQPGLPFLHIWFHKGDRNKKEGVVAYATKLESPVQEQSMVGQFPVSHCWVCV